MDSKATGTQGVVLGHGAVSNGNRGVAIGTNSNSKVANGVAIGSDSQAVRGAGVQGYVSEGTQLTDEQKNSSTWNRQWARLLLAQMVILGKSQM